MTSICGGTKMHMGAERRSVNMLVRGAAGLLVGLLLSFGAALAQSPMDKPIKDKPIKIVAFGDSLTAGFMLAPDQAFPVVLAKALQAKGYDVEMINAGVSGDTSSGARERLAWAVPEDADGVILEFGANDALRGVDPDVARRNLDAMIQELVAARRDVLLAGMLAPRSMGDDYTKSFDAIYPALAARYGLLLYPFFIEKTALDPKLSLPDGLHPNAKGVEAIVAGILPKVEELIGRIRSRRLAGQKG